ncbi:hypothetical protein [Nevskia sp.]|uniref:hypothetical protein n=1 Tax=Nevskia sp. TaxID=1929292 RepID=UPI0025FC72C3|nr:hypothetical protein [Nevskia sp.]
MRVPDVISAEHPALPGHFPGRPIVPGVLLLDRVVAAVLADAPGCVLVGFPAAKFLRPLAGDEAFEIFWQREGELAAFRCLIGDTLVAEGRLQLRAIAPT